MLDDAYNSNMSISFRLFRRVVLFSFCLIFVCSYHGGGTGYNREDLTDLCKLKEKSNNEISGGENFLGQRKCIPNFMTENAKRVDNGEGQNNTVLNFLF